MTNKTLILFRKLYSKHPNILSFWFLFFLIYFPIASFLFTSLALMLFIFWPFQHYQIDFPDVSSESLVVISHGLKDSNRSWAQVLKQKIQAQGQGIDVIALDWSPYSDNAFTCAVNGRRIGNRLAELASRNAHLTEVRLVGHSCGAFINYGFCETLKSLKKEVIIATVYLDPVSVYGGIMWNYGINNFGKCADTSMTFFDTEDSVPGSNRAPVNSNGLDVTELKEKINYSGHPHQWPIYYYINSLDAF